MSSLPPSSEDPTGWLLESDIAQFLLMHTKEIRYMCMLAYTFLHGTFVRSLARGRENSGLDVIQKRLLTYGLLLLYLL